jgi:hypothetical protein
VALSADVFGGVSQVISHARPTFAGAWREAWLKVGTSTTSRGFTFDAPVVSTTTPNAAPTAGGTVTISGLSFGAAGASATASLTAADACGSSAWTSATTVACAPQAYGGPGVVRTAVSVGAVAGTVLGQFSFDGVRIVPSPLRSFAVVHARDFLAVQRRV